jgi:hypothetical protein
LGGTPVHWVAHTVSVSLPLPEAVQGAQLAAAQDARLVAAPAG